MDLKKLEVPTSSITEVKRSPMDVFDQARKAETGVYIFNREKVAGVMLTQEQYETLLQELADLRQKANEEVQAPIESNELLGNYTDQTAAVVSTSDGLDELVQTLKRYLITGITISAKNLDERMVTLGFITKKTGFGGVVDMLNELTATGKINYQLRRKPNSRTVIAEIIGEQDSQSQLFDKIIIKKIYLHEL
ncbi:type II toxin-antitoxin system Phd/YefM family antitoxin [Enterococcus hirae]|uniref:prevent-host-death protein n=1 Tax=Enterococcus TaxID=1350 RepID=UPI0009BFDF2F|nr:prevent-host-death protein [Enterococcus hirae]EMF0050367.1 type II toxin-antitoxin system Phd/YefM family antitoxin [Enterococcus hirae]EMF0082725.1 type II toxin-antitoxin system Phd/YefM family antitoxin [Enterococcus hirae]EMF0093696.1 type II toxin-antitoxin system Phd/YefM family antitoxin [Enterococcus hirae]EMF0098136.1 type II toxin-antitoxin system Phd/YefM family antitoxin [Enterococcus hirae]EMF0101202.1 type II toxin-antitoxin system Phd/YefM family antitoxin [Enterococcus hira